MLVFDEAHKIFHRHDDFRRSYSALATIHDVFPGHTCRNSHSYIDSERPGNPGNRIPPQSNLDTWNR
eukprot:gene13271-14638_t